ncbi:glycosyltransferase family 2 protein [Flavobacterium sp.]|uniref:glycosyltransferase family 2 protein n=1 Tax=Flavobacterium sp. TaxID=239 RepID=UPI0039E49B44
MKINKLHKAKIAVAIPYYNASRHICDVVAKLPDFIDAVIITDDKSPEPMDQDAIRLAAQHPMQIVFLENPVNLGVGGATMKSFQYAIDHGFEIVVKMDADDQMDPKFLPQLIFPLLKNDADMAKGNRFRDLNALKKMPFGRRMGNLMLSFLTKIATGYWNNFDPNNGYLAIKVSYLQQLDFSKLSSRYFFETSLISQLYFIKARIKDVAMPAIYGDEISSMKVWHMPLVFSTSLIKVYFKRILKEYFLYDFNIASLYLLTGLPLFLFGVVFGIIKWIYYYSHDILAPTGTIMVFTLSIILGFQLLLQAIQYDIINAPKPNN